MRDRLNRIFARETGQPLERIEEDTHRNFWLGAEAALRYGLVGRIIERVARARPVTGGARWVCVRSSRPPATGSSGAAGTCPCSCSPLLLVAAASVRPGARAAGSTSPGKAAACCWRWADSACARRRSASCPATPRGAIPAGRWPSTLNTSGLYSVVRHPLYLGNYLMWLGVALFSRTWWAPVIVSLVFWLYYERIMFAEEEFLRRQFG